jgi:hypothetical protein
LSFSGRVNIERAVDASDGNGGACRVGRRSCFYHKVALGGDKAKLVFD